MNNVAKILALALSSVPLLSGCGTAAGLIGKLPEVQDKQQASTVIVYRLNQPERITNATFNNFTIAVDGDDVFGIQAGTNVRFLVSPGSHVVTVKCFGGFTPTTKEDSVDITAEKITTIYLEARSTISLTKCAEITRVDAATGAKGVAATLDLVK